ncbi:MAG: helix-turn-helix transcriptional regulator [Burkholderiales bacterium]
MEHDLSRLLLEIHRGGRTIAPGQFQDWALEQIKAHIPFDAAMWGYGAVQDHTVHPHAAHVQRMPDSAQAEIFRLWQYDALHRKALQQIDSQVTCTASAFRLAPDSPLRQYHIEHILCSLIVDPLSRLLTTIAFCRSADKPAFAPGELDLNQALLPHVVDVYGNNRLDHLMQLRDAESSNYAPALADTEGMLHVTDKRFPPIMLVEWPTWNGPYLPRPLMLYLKDDHALAYTGRTLVAYATIADDEMLLRVRKKHTYDDLGKREHEVAELFARGLSYKEIAKALAISPSTVGNHLYTVYAKLGISNKLELAKMVSEMH